MVFKNDGQLSRHENYANNKLVVDNGFDYVGIHFSSTLSLYKMAEHMSIKAKRVLLHVLSSFKNYSYVPYKTFFKVFDAKIMPIMLYGSESWGLKNMVCIDNVHMLGCMRFLNVQQNACNDVVLGDLGRYLCIYIHQNVALNTGLVYLICQILDTQNYVMICLCIMIGLAIVIGRLLLEKIYIVTALATFGNANMSIMLNCFYLCIRIG